MAQKRMNFTKHGRGDGIMAAADIVGRAGNRKVSDELTAYNQLNTTEAKVAYAKQLADLTVRNFQRSWPVAYEVLNLIKEHEIYKWKNPEGKQAYETFADYYEATFKKAFNTWAELEETYHFVADNDPTFFEKTYTKAKGLLKSSLAKVGRPEKTERNQQIREDYDSGMTQQAIADKYEITQQKVSRVTTLLSNFDNKVVKQSGTQNSVSKENNISRYSQNKLDYLAKNAVELFNRINLPKDDPERLSIHGAYKKARGLQDPIQVMPVPEKIAIKIKERLTPAQIAQLITLLQD